MMPVDRLPARQFKRQWPTRWVALTIAAGFRFAGGVLLCADSEMTHGTELKTRGSKIFPYSFKASGSKAVFTFSGDVPLSKMCIQKIAHKLASDAEDRRSLSMMYDSASEQLYEFHHKYVFKHPRYGYGDGPCVNLIIGMWSAQDQQLGLYQSSEEALIEVDDLDAMAITGSGSSFASYVARPLVPHGLMGIADLVTVGTYVLKEAKEHVPGCGKSSELITITAKGEIGNLGWLHSSEVEKVADGFTVGMQHLFLETCDLDTPEEQVRERFDGLWMVIEATRKALLRDREMRQGLVDLIDRMVQRKVKEI